MKAASFALDPDIKTRVLPVSVNLISQKEYDYENNNIESIGDVEKFKEKMLSIGNFDEYVENFH